jgi:hypothetical protein
MTKSVVDRFSPIHHALLFAWISKAVFDRVGEERAEAVIRKAVRRYGEQRGGRMALRAEANGHALSMLNYLAYGEWRAAPGESIQKVVDKVPHVVAHVHKCPWHQAWQEKDLLPYGRLYCQEVDEALVRGFNPELKIEVRGTKPEGNELCEFVFHDANLGLFNTLLMGYRRAVKPADKSVMPWEYHMGHLYKTMGEVLGEEIGELGGEAMNAALKEFTRSFGDDAVDAIRAYSGTDFNRLPID